MKMGAQAKALLWQAYKFIWLYKYNSRNQEKLRARQEHKLISNFSVVHSQGLASKRFYTSYNIECWDLLCKKLLNPGRDRGVHPEGLTILSCNNNSGISVLEQSLQAMDFPQSRVRMLGKEVRTWSHIEKIRLIQEGLRSVETPYVLYVDSSDALVVTLHQTIQDFTNQNVDLIFGAERDICHPGNFMKREEKARAKRLGYPGKYVYLNAGVWMAKTEFARQFFSHCARVPPSNVMPCDQAICRKVSFEYPESVALDYRGALFKNIQLSEYEELFLP